MTVLLLAQRKFFPLRILIGLDRVKILFLEINRRGLATFILITSIFISTFLYIGALYFTFDLGIRIQEGSRALQKVREKLLVLDLEVQKNEAKLVEDHQAILKSMEKASAVKYLPEGSFIASQPQSRP